jgi:hypothetical protein
VWRITSKSCSNCNGTGRTHNFAPGTSHVANPGNAPCIRCNSTGRIEKRVWVEPSNGSSGAVNIDPSTGQIQMDTRTPEEKRSDQEKTIASVIGLCLAAMIAGPLIWNGLIAWWVALGIGLGTWYGMYKVFIGPMRIVAILGRMIVNAVMTSIAIALALGVVGLIAFFVYKVLVVAPG